MYVCIYVLTKISNQTSTQGIMLVYYIKQRETKWLAPVFKDVMLLIASLEIEDFFNFS